MQNDNENKLMALREFLMEYFKGTCGSRFADHSRMVVLPSNPTEVSDNRFEARRTLGVRIPRLVAYDNNPVLSVVQYPDEVTLHIDGTLASQLREFFGKYLPGVLIWEESHQLREPEPPRGNPWSPPANIIFDEYN